MNALEKVLTLRPGNAAARLGHASRLPLLNPRDLVTALGDRPSALLCVALSVPEQAGGILRAARDRDALVGLSCVHDPGRRELASTFFEHVRRTTDEYGHRRPVFLQAGPLRILDAEPRSIAALEGAVFRYVDAGFSTVSLDASALPTEGAQQVYAQVARAAIERELAVEVTFPGASRPTSDALGAFLSALAGLRVRPEFVRLRSTMFLPEALPGAEVEGDFAALQELQQVAEASGTRVSLEDRGTPLRTVPSWNAARVRKVDASEAFAEVVLQALSPQVASELRGESRETGVLLSTLLGERPMLTAQLPEAARHRIEALAYSEASDLLRAFGAVGSATHAMEALAASTEE